MNQVVCHRLFCGEKAIRFRSVELDIVNPFGGNVFVGKDCAYRANGLAVSAVDAKVRDDVELLFTLDKAVDGANLNARFIFHSTTRIGYNVGQRFSFLLNLECT
jgi:hypothetical protein